MGNKIIKKGDYILITDPNKNRYLKIGEVINIGYYSDGDIKEYIVRFGYNCHTDEDDLEFYRYDLPEMCKVLAFR